MVGFLTEFHPELFSFFRIGKLCSQGEIWMKQNNGNDLWSKSAKIGRQ